MKIYEILQKIETGMYTIAPCTYISAKDFFGNLTLLVLKLEYSI